jgi:hypothetical protein
MTRSSGVPCASTEAAFRRSGYGDDGLALVALEEAAEAELRAAALG